jgi:hypothetical protein
MLCYNMSRSQLKAHAEVGQRCHVMLLLYMLCLLSCYVIQVMLRLCYNVVVIICYVIRCYVMLC